jgi:hypothetical protein
MKKLVCTIAILALFICQTFSQQRITKKELETLKKYNDAATLLKDDADFSGSNTAKWDNESAVILCQKTSFDFDKKGLSVGKRIGRNLLALLWAPVTLGATIYAANVRNETTILVEETERRKILLNDKYALELYSILYFRLAAEGDAFAARVIKKDGTIQKIDFTDAVKVEDVRSVPSLFKSYTESEFKSNYRPDFFKIAISDLEEGDAIEYEYKNYNSTRYTNNPNYKEFEPVYYLCNRSLPVNKQIIEVTTEDDKYYMAFKSLKGAPDFVVTNNGDKKVYRWEDNNRPRLTDNRFVNEYLELPSIKFQLTYARNNRKDFVWFKDEEDTKKDMTPEDLGNKAKQFWFANSAVQSSAIAMGESSYNSVINYYYKDLKKKGITQLADDEYARKAYYLLRSKTMYNNCSDYDFAKIFSGLLREKNLDHEIVVTTPNYKTSIEKVAFTQEIGWLVKFKNKYYANPDEHLNPEELPIHVNGNTAVKFNYTNQADKATSMVLPVSDTTENAWITQISVSLDTNKANLAIAKTVETRGLMKNEMIDDILTYTPYMETDFKNYDGMSMWDGMSDAASEKATSEFKTRKKDWKEEKPKLMKAYAEAEYNCVVEKYDDFKLVQDGRTYKKKPLKYTETLTLQNFTAKADDDIVLPLPKLIGTQTKIKKDERTRTLPIDTRFPRILAWNITLAIPAGYTAKGIDGLNKTIDNDAASFTCKAKVENNTIVLDVKKVYKGKNFDVAKWPSLMAVLDAAYSFSQAKIILKKN